MQTYKQILKRAKRFSAEQIAAKMPISRRAVYALFSGECKDPKYSTVRALHQATSRLEAAKASRKKAA